MLTAFASEFGLSDDTALKIAAPFGGGMARRGNTCGAVSGGLMVLGLNYGYTTPDGRDATYAIANEFMHSIEERHGSLVCRELIGHDINTPENRALAEQSGVFKNICPHLVRDVVDIVVLLLNS